MNLKYKLVIIIKRHTMHRFDHKTPLQQQYIYIFLNNLQILEQTFTAGSTVTVPRYGGGHRPDVATPPHTLVLKLDLNGNVVSCIFLLSVFK